MFLKADLVIWSLLVLIVLVLIVLGFILWVASRPEKENRGQAKKLVRMRNDTLRASFRQAVELIEANIASRAQRLTLPWVLVLNEGGESDPLPLGQSGIPQALSADSSASVAAQGISWNFFDKGIVINMLGAYLGTPDSDDDTERPWEEFLSLCRDYRPERPFDSLVVNVPVELLISSDPNSRLELSRVAKLANRRLWKAQNRFAMRFSVYVTVSGCERLTGFAPFARSLPEALRKSMLGWSSPFEISAMYQENWVDQAVDHTVQTLSDTSAELYVLNLEGDSSPYFLLPGQIASLRPQLQLYVNELMRPSTYHEPFLMRGIYFTGDAGEAAERDLRVMDDSNAPVQIKNSALTAIHATEENADTFSIEPPIEVMPETKVQLPVAQNLTHAHPRSNHDGYRFDPAPVFLRDLFEQKIFAEYGLARPSGSQLTSRPLLGRGARWAAWTLIGGWSLGLLVGSVILHKQSNAVFEVLTKFNSDSEHYALALRNGETISAEAKNRRAVALLDVMEQMDGTRLWSVFMPGSWPIVDSLSIDLQEYLDRAFGDIAAATLHRALQTKVSQLTGVPQDESTGDLIQGASCKAQSTADDRNVKNIHLGFQEFPEFAALLSYLTSVEQISQAFVAMQRLQASDIAPNPRDLQLLVKLVFGADLNFVSQRSSELFRSKATSTSKINLASAQEAIRCALSQHTTLVQTAAFVNNPLLTSQWELNESVNLLTEAVDETNEAQTQLEFLTALLADIKQHEALLAAGARNSAWMRQATFSPGAVWDNLLTRITATPLLGAGMAMQTKGKFEESYQGLVIELNEQLASNSDTEVIWDDNELRYTLGTALLDLRTGLTALMAEPYMSTANNLPAPDLNTNLGASHALNWELQRLDEALASVEQRKKFKSDILPRFPVNSQRAIEKIISARLSNQVMTHVNAALVPRLKPTNSTLDLATMEAERTRLARVQLLLADLNARRDADDLRSLITRDAIRKLQTLDETLNRSELYAAKGHSFLSWKGELSPVLGAFGLPDASGLQPYLAQQVARVEQLSKEADAVLSLLPTSANSHFQALRWQAISRDLERFKLKNPNSTLLGLENFLTAMSGDVDGKNCQERLQGYILSGRPSDFFAERHSQLLASLTRRCSELRLKEQQALWASFSSNFNQGLAGRPPFASPGWSAEAPVIELEEIPPLLQGYERARPAMHAFLKQQNDADDSVAVKRFLDQFDRIRNFLAPLLPPEENTPVGYDVAVEFRANQDGEIQGNKVIDWSLEIGRQRLDLRDKPKPLRWEPGQPITITLRLAKDGQFSPLADPKQPALSVEGKTVTLRFSDAWSLFNLIGRQREAEARNDGRSQLLRVEFPLETDNPAVLGILYPGKGAKPSLPAFFKPAEVGEKRAKVYLRLTLSPPGKRTPLIWPGPLPTRAPEPLKP